MRLGHRVFSGSQTPPEPGDLVKIENGVYYFITPTSKTLKGMFSRLGILTESKRNDPNSVFYFNNPNEDNKVFVGQWNVNIDPRAFVWVIMECIKRSINPQDINLNEIRIIGKPVEYIQLPVNEYFFFVKVNNTALFNFILSLTKRLVIITNNPTQRYDIPISIEIPETTSARAAAHARKAILEQTKLPRFLNGDRAIPSQSTHRRDDVVPPKCPLSIDQDDARYQERHSMPRRGGGPRSKISGTFPDNTPSSPAIPSP